MSEIPPIAGVSPTAAPRDAAAPADLPFAAGQRLFARVVQVLSESSAILDLAGQRLMTSTPVPVAVGQVLNVAVRGLGQVVDLELIDPPVAFSEEAYARAAVLEAKQATPSVVRVPLEDVRALLRALERAPTPAHASSPGTTAEATRSEQHARASSALLPLPLQADGAQLAEALHRAITRSGLFFENRLASLAERGAASLDINALKDDVRAVLAEMAAHTSESTPLEDARARLVADVLARQIDAAWHKLRDGELRLDVPVLIEESSADVHLRVRDERPPSENEPAPAGRTIELALELPELGRVRASIRWTPGHLGARFAVEGATQEQALQRDLGALGQRLQAAGFRAVALRVDVDPDGVSFAADDPDRPDDPNLLPPGGSILRVRV